MAIIQGSVLSAKAPALFPEAPPFCTARPVAGGTNTTDRCHQLISGYFNRVFIEHGQKCPMVRALIGAIIRNPSLRDKVQAKTETALLWRWKERTPLGDVLSGAQASQENPSESVLSGETYQKAEEEAGKLLNEIAPEPPQKLPQSIQLKNGNSVAVEGERVYLKLRSGERQPLHIEEGADPSVFSNGDGPFAVTWTRRKSPESAEGTVYGQLFNSDGTLLTLPFPLSSNSTQQGESGARGILLNSRQAVYVWKRSDQVILRYYSLEENEAQEEIILTPSSAVGRPHIFLMKGETYLVTWQEFNPDTKITTTLSRVIERPSPVDPLHFHPIIPVASENVALLGETRFVVWEEDQGVIYNRDHKLFCFSVDTSPFFPFSPEIAPSVKPNHFFLVGPGKKREYRVDFEKLRVRPAAPFING